MICPDEWQVRGVNDRVQLAELRAELNRRLLERVDARRRHGGRPRHHLGRRPGAAGARRRAAPGHPAARRHHGGRRRGDRAGHHAHRRRGRARRPRGAHARQRFGDRRGRVRRAVRLPATRVRGSASAARSARSSRSRTSEIGEGSKVPHLTYVGDADDRRALQHRRQLDVRQLRRHPQAPHGDRLARPHRLRHEVHRAALRRRRRVHRGGRRPEERRAAGRAGRFRWAPTHHRRLGGEEPPRHARPPKPHGPPPRG